MLVSDRWPVYNYVLYHFIDAINNAGGKTNVTAGIFATYPQTYLTIGNGFLDQVKKKHRLLKFHKVIL